MAQMTADRTESKAANEKTIKEAKEAQVAVEEAIAVLKDYYSKSVEATAMVQQTPLEELACNRLKEMCADGRL
eukprot:5663702-Amphidinium_carterae.1